MNADEYRKLERVFHAIVDHPTEERHSLLEQHCGSDLELRSEVERLLYATENAMGEFMHVADDDASLSFDHTPERIGQYRIRRLIASGGMGSVYEAEQENPRRAVALKIMKGIASGSALQRFEYESQVLARLRHAGIAQVFEAGTHQEGRSTVPYFAMEFVPEAQRITEFANARKLGIRARLQLFLQVCNAVHHGHQKGIIHRDLKPANILVDAQGDVKVIDFGIARANDADLAITRVQTGEGQLIGTLQYMSPEQVNADPNDVDVRSDVYALGLVLYELICGQPPYDVRNASVYDAIRIIREQGATRPGAISSAIQSDIETITLKAIEKDRERRYQSADDLGADIRRYLAGEPIAARAPSAVYQLRVFARRNKAAFASIAVVFVVLVGASIFSTWQYLRADRARADAVAAGREAESRRASEERQRRKAEAINLFVTNALISTDPHQGGKHGFLVTDAMEQAVELLDSGELKDDPETQAALFLTISRILDNNARTPEAVQLAQRALDIYEELHADDHPDLARCLNDVGLCLQSLGRSTEALEKFEAALAMRKRIHTTDHSDVAASLNNLAGCLRALGRSAEALPRFEAAMEMYQRVIDGDDSTVATSMNDVAACLQSLGRPSEAIPLHEAAMEMYQRLYDGDHPNVASSLSNLGACLGALGRPADALPKLEAAQAMYQRIYQSDHPDVAYTMNNVASCLLSLGRLPDALSRHEEALAMYQRLFDGDHPELATSLLRVGDCLDRLGRSADALPKCEAALEMRQRLFEGDHPGIAECLNIIAFCLNALGRSEEALSRYEAALEMRQRLFEGDHPAVALAMNNVAFCLRSLGRSEEALPRFEAALEMWRRLFDGDHPHIANCLNNIAACLKSLDRPSEALSKYEEALEIWQRVFKGDHPNIAQCMNNIANCLHYSMGQSEAALPKFEAALEMRQRLFKGDHPQVAESLLETGECLRSLDRADESISMLERALEMYRRVSPANHPNLARAEIALARALRRVDRFAEAELLLRDAADQCESSPASRRQHWTAVVRESIGLYSAWQMADPIADHQSNIDAWQAIERELISN